MNAYIFFTESVIYFTPSAITLIDHEHVTIKVITPRPFLRRRGRNTYTGRHEIAAYVPTGFSGRFWVYVAVDHNPRKKYVAKWFRLEIKVDDGVITDVMNRCPEDLNPSGVMVTYPSGAYDTSGYEWHSRPANSAFVWLP